MGRFDAIEIFTHPHSLIYYLFIYLFIALTAQDALWSFVYYVIESLPYLFINSFIYDGVGRAVVVRVLRHRTTHA